MAGPFPFETSPSGPRADVRGVWSSWPGWDRDCRQSALKVGGQSSWTLNIEDRRVLLKRREHSAPSVRFKSNWKII